LIEAWPVLTNGVAAAAIITGTDLTERWDSLSLFSPVSVCLFSSLFSMQI
jgi:hypothetical protein